MNPHRKWFMLRFAAGIMLCAVVAGGYGFFASWHAIRNLRAATTEAANLLGDCAQPREDGRSLNDTLASCGAAAQATETAAQVLHHSAKTSGRFAASGIVFVRMFSLKAPDATPGLAERLAAFADDLGGLAAWWPTASMRLTVLAGYDAQTDLQGVSALNEPEDLIRRLYLAKGALKLIDRSLSAPSAAAYDARLEGISEALTLIDRLIITTNTGSIEASDILRTQYIFDMKQLSRRATSVQARVEQLLLPRPWSATARELAGQLR